jgi:sterol desaturase/sphingolipid hydroxylase (fatty acid hydroxylase superfamily)
MFENVNELGLAFLAVATVFVLLEWAISSRRKNNLYSQKDTFCNLATLVIGRLSQPLFIAYVYGSLKFLQSLALFKIPDSEWTTVVAFVLTDFFYYWEHRFSHSWKPLWVLHETHHSSTHFNFTTSFRLPWLGRLVAPIFFGPMVIFGFKPEQLVLFFSLNLMYQFFLHTKLIAKLGVLEGIFNTPSAHRVHHGRNAMYLDKNFGGVLMIWDRVFGTYQAEIEQPEFGLRSNFLSNNPFVVQFHSFPMYGWVIGRWNALRNQIVISLMLILSSFAFLCNRAESQEETAIPNCPIQGHVQIDEISGPSLLGKWKGHIFEFRRHPAVSIESQEGSKLNGTYQGVLGKFPLTGLLHEDNSRVTFYVDFTSAKFLRLLFRKHSGSLVAILDGKLVGNTISGTACLPDISDKEVRFSASKEDAQ